MSSYLEDFPMLPSDLEPRRGKGLSQYWETQGPFVIADKTFLKLNTKVPVPDIIVPAVCSEDSPSQSDACPSVPLASPVDPKKDKPMPMTLTALTSGLNNCHLEVIIKYTQSLCPPTLGSQLGLLLFDELSKLPNNKPYTSLDHKQYLLKLEAKNPECFYERVEDYHKKCKEIGSI